VTSRGACPGISQPMATGDGLLARLMPAAAIPLDALIALCEAGARHGNGIIEVTQRGSLQVRGLSAESAPAFAQTALALRLGDDGGPPILASPLMGLDPRESADLRPLVDELRAALPSRIAAASLGPKVSVLIDGGGTLHLDDVPGDLRLRAGPDSRLHLSIAGTAAAAMSLGWTKSHDALEVMVRVLAGIAGRGTDARARDFADDAGLCVLRASLANLLSDEAAPQPRPAAEPVGIQALRNGQAALGVALAFGYSEAGALKSFAEIAARCGATSIQPAPGRALLILGLMGAGLTECTAAAAAAGFVVRPDDPRRHVVACAGAPACGSAKLSTRALAPAIAQAAAPLLDGSLIIHLSGCAKGCAHPGAAALTLVGPDRLVVLGRAGDTPHGTAAAADFIGGLVRLQAQWRRPHAAGERSVDMLTRLGAARVLAVMRGEGA
jgi:precorrin-3B synthase